MGPFLGPGLSVLRHSLTLAPKGVGLEFGVATGESLRVIAEVMPAVGFDSFKGLPTDWRPGWPVGMFACDPPNVPGATLVVGLFADTLPTWTPPDRVALVHIDCDLYSSTVTVLEHIGPHLTSGTVVVFDEYHGYLGCQDGEAKAWAEYTQAHDISWTPAGHGPEQLAVVIA